jgi:HK97 family phage major capsid protein
MRREVKQFNGEPTYEPEVVAQVQAEIKKLGDNHKKNYEELRKAHEELKKIVDEKGTKMDAETKQMITKLAEDITTRQDAIDVMLRRPGFEVPNAKVATMPEAKEWKICTLLSKRGEEGVSYDEMQNLDVDIEDYLEYKTAFENLLRKPKEMLSPEMIKALQVGVDPEGGYTVTPAMSNKIITRLFEMDPIRQLANVESITTGAMEWLVDWGDAGYGWEGETETGPETDTPEWKKKRIPVHTMYAKPHATQNLVEDSGINIESWLANKVSNRLSRLEGAAFVNGNTPNTPRGFLTYPDGTNYGQINAVGMLHATDVTADGFIRVKYSLIEQYLERGTWLMNRLTVADTMYLKDGVGNYLWKPAFSADQPSTILSLPVRMSTSMPLTGVASNLAVALADWKEAYQIVDRLGITVQKDPYTVKPFIEYYTRKRTGGDISNPEAIVLGRMSVA